VNTVKLNETGDVRQLKHGSTIHGAHRILGLDGMPMTGRPQPMGYYHDGGAINLAVKASRIASAGKLPNVAVLGLGAGGLACQAVADENWVFFEIDKEVVTLAQRAELFPFLTVCTPGARVVTGDARLTLQKESLTYDVIILDAFSSDSIPTHLLTKEAFEIYQSRLKPDGVIIAHVSNRYMDIRSVAEAAGVATGMATVSAHIGVDPGDIKARLQDATPTVAVAMSHDPEKLQGLVATGHWRKPGDTITSLLWTDDYANILGAVARETGFKLNRALGRGQILRASQ
jgi:spermidine synthase